MTEVVGLRPGFEGWLHSRHPHCLLLSRGIRVRADKGCLFFYIKCRSHLNCILTTVFLMSWNKLFILQERFEFMEVIKYFFWDYQIIFILTLSKVKWTAFKTDLMVEKMTSHLLRVIGPHFTVDRKWSFLTFPIALGAHRMAYCWVSLFYMQNLQCISHKSS